MSYNSPDQHGIAEYKSWMHIPENIASGIVEGGDVTPFENRKYAKMVYLANASDISSGGSTVAVTGFVGSTPDTEPDKYSRLITNDGTYDYIMYCENGNNHTSGESVWQIRRIDSDGTLMWADGDSLFDNPASGYTTASYSF